MFPRLFSGDWYQTPSETTLVNVVDGWQSLFPGLVPSGASAQKATQQFNNEQELLYLP